MAYVDWMMLNIPVTGKLFKKLCGRENDDRKNNGMMKKGIIINGM